MAINKNVVHITNRIRIRNTINIVIGTKTNTNKITDTNTSANTRTNNHIITIAGTCMLTKHAEIIRVIVRI